MKLRTEYTECGCGFKQLINENTNEVLLSGDYYHDKICAQIDGYIKALNDNKIPYEYRRISINCPYGCDE